MTEQSPPKSIPRSEFTGEMLRAAYNWQDAYVIELLIAAGHVTQEKVDEAREIAASVVSTKQ